MTREEAKQWLEAMKSTYALPIETYEAIDMAIEALNNSIQMSNIQEIQAKNSFLKEMVKFYREQSTKVVRCKDCRWYEPKYKDKEYDCPQGLYAVYENDYCSHGERRES